MPRRKLENGYYHIYNRGVEKEFIFKNDNDFERFYKIIASYNKIEEFCEIKILAFCFLPNHFHLIVKNNLEEAQNLSKFMGIIQNAYSKYFNLIHKRKGILFQGRFKDKKINSERYLQQATTYVCFNPVKHKIVENISDYKWTSYHQISKDKLKKFEDLFLEELEI